MGVLESSDEDDDFVPAARRRAAHRKRSRLSLSRSAVQVADTTDEEDERKSPEGAGNGDDAVDAACDARVPDNMDAFLERDEDIPGFAFSDDECSKSVSLHDEEWEADKENEGRPPQSQEERAALRKCSQVSPSQEVRAASHRVCPQSVLAPTQSQEDRQRTDVEACTADQEDSLLVQPFGDGGHWAWTSSRRETTPSLPHGSSDRPDMIPDEANQGDDHEVPLSISSDDNPAYEGDLVYGDKGDHGDVMHDHDEPVLGEAQREFLRSLDASTPGPSTHGYGRAQAPPRLATQGCGWLERFPHFTPIGALQSSFSRFEDSSEPVHIKYKAQFPDTKTGKGKATLYPKRKPAKVKKTKKRRASKGHKRRKSGGRGVQAGFITAKQAMK